MNSGKKIDINRSTLISLKAELSRKQEEVSVEKTKNQFAKPPVADKKQKKDSEKKGNIWDKKRIEKSKQDGMTEEERENYLKSRSALEAKARLYEELSSPNASKSEILAAQQCLLVDFKRKQREREQEEGEIEEIDDTPVGNYGDEDDWAEYTDCLGRTRRCLKADLPDLQRQNQKLADSLGMQEQSRSRSNSPERRPRPPTPPLEQQLVSGDLQREALREKWEKEEAELRKKEDIHYQDILYDEVRNHGVSYYAFSKDEKLRKAQQEQLAKVRAETKKQQKSAEEGRERRAQQLKARLKAAANRKRLRQGLPPLPDTDEETEKNASDEEAEMELLLGKSSEKPQEPEPLVREERPPPAVVRPWDKHKETYVMSQEEWNEAKRAERKNEFAPPSSFSRGSGYNRPRRRSRSRSPPRRVSSSSSSDDEVVGPLPPRPPSPQLQASNPEESILAGLSYLRRQVEDSF